MRDGTVIHETSIAQLKRFKDDVREVAEGFECGILLDGFNDVKEGDVLEAFEIREVERTEPTPRLRRRLLRRPRNRASRGDPSVALGHEQACHLAMPAARALVAGGAGMDAVAPKPARVLGGEGCPVEDS